MPPDLERRALRNGRFFLLARYLLLAGYVLSSLDRVALREIGIGFVSSSALKNIATGIALGIALALCRDLGRRFWAGLDWSTPRNPMRMGSPFLFFLLGDVGELGISLGVFSVHLEVRNTLGEGGPFAVLFSLSPRELLDTLKETGAIRVIAEGLSAYPDDAEFFRHPFVDVQVVQGRDEFSEVQVSAAAENKNQGSRGAFIVALHKKVFLLMVLPFGMKGAGLIDTLIGMRAEVIPLRLD